VPARLVSESAKESSGLSEEDLGMTSAAAGKGLSFDLNRDLLDGKIAAAVEVTGRTDKAALEVLLKNEPFPPGEIEVGKIAVAGSAGSDKITFASDRGKVSFSGSASVFAGMGVFRTSTSALEALTFDPETHEHLGGLEIPLRADELFLMFRWGYALSGSIKGAVALGTPGAVTFGAEGSREAQYAIIRRFPDKIPSREAVTEIVKSWRMPTQVTTAADLAPGTWIITEVNGSFQASLGIEVGYNFSWIRKTKLGGLAGDIGLKIQLGLTTAMKFFASGKYAVILGRESEENILRLRIFKLSLRGLDFGLNAGASVDTVAEIPEDVDDFVAAVFGVHGAQLIKDLQAIEQWASLDQGQLPAGLAKLTSDYGKQLLKVLTGIDPLNPPLFQKAKSELLGSLNAWNRLDAEAHATATLIWHLLSSDDPGIDELRTATATLRNSDDDGLCSFLEEHLADVQFFKTATGRWLESFVTGNVLSALTSTEELVRVRNVADLTHQVLDPAGAGAVIKELVKYIRQRFALNAITKAIEKADLAPVDKWLQAKLGDFLEKELDLEQLKEIQGAIQHILSLRKQIYEQARKALNRSYSFEFTTSYRKATTKTALADIAFNFDRDPGGAFRAAIDGDLGKLLINPPAGVQIRAGELSCGIKKQSHVGVSLPFFNARIDHTNDSLARLTVKGDGAAVYLLNATDVIRERDRRASALTIGASLAPTTSDIRIHDRQSFTYSYSFRQATFDMRILQLKSELRPYAMAYLPTAFDTGDFDRWIDRIADEIDATKDSNGPDVFGKTLITLNVSLGGEILGAWLHAPSSKKDPAYAQLSLRIQESLRMLVPFYYFSDLDRYKTLDPAAALLAYSSLPLLNDVRVNESGKLKAVTNGDIIWDIEDTNLLAAIIEDPRTTKGLLTVLKRISPLLKATGRDPKGFYAPGELARNRILGTVLQGQGRTLLMGLLRGESNIMKKAVEAGQAIANFRVAQDEPEKAIEFLAQFGANLTEAFNKEAGDFVFEGALLRPLSTMVFVAATTVFDPGLVAKTKAMLTVSALANASPFTQAQFLQGEEPSSNDVLVEDRVTAF